ncbi:DUF4864 domain-containing protein [Palleronia sp. LCG004]|uniref:DUF4864 domain-containing protein n=1 Tax=Palleronia sp. LCG004 TaxID=3079304 RepID=UPI002942F48C|nr:DUF4864 domain-containing protein [Palleronia sp. LCG004]WOI57502.1 DUF4864 domain-containing protein [Palleronia sp. LCG004]
MKRLAATLIGLATIGQPLFAQEDQIESVIRDQIEAFRGDDFASAFEHASPGIRDLFGTPEQFGRMVEQGYPMVHRPSEVVFLTLREEDGEQKQRVMMRGDDGAVHILEYDMVRIDGVWRIDGVRLLDAARIGV